MWNVAAVLIIRRLKIDFIVMGLFFASFFDFITAASWLLAARMPLNNLLSVWNYKFNLTMLRRRSAATWRRFTVKCCILHFAFCTIFYWVVRTLHDFLVKFVLWYVVFSWCLVFFVEQWSHLAYHCFYVEHWHKSSLYPRSFSFRLITWRKHDVHALVLWRFLWD